MKLNKYPIYKSLLTLYHKVAAIIYRKLEVRTLLFILVGMLVVCVIATIVSRSIMKRSLEQPKITDHLMFEITYGHNFIVRDIDVTLRGMGIINDERYLYRSNEYIAIDLENNFMRLDSLLIGEHFTDSNGIKAINNYKSSLRSFVSYHKKMLEFLRSGQREDFVREFSKDVGATMWPAFTRAVEEVSKHERMLESQALIRYNFFSIAMVYVQSLTLLLSIPIVFLVFARLKNERRTARILEERKLIDERNKTKEHMLSVMSHEIRTPLNSMIGLTQVLKRRNPRPDQVEIIDTLKTSGDHLLHLVNELLDYNKIQAKKLDLENVSFNLLECLKQLHVLFIRAAQEKRIGFNIQISATLPPVLKGDPSRLIQILSNLLSNAIKFTPDGFVNLYARLVNKTGNMCIIEFTVEDTGIGIPAEKLHLLYEPFTQIEAQTHRKYGGSGLGLLIVKSLVEAMKGTLQLASTPGEITTVTATIPFQIEEEVDHPQSSQQVNIISDEIKGLNALYVEDVESNQFVVKTMLEDAGASCSIANNGEEALFEVAERKFDIILLDVQLPDISGDEVATRIRAERSVNQNTPIILFSAETGMTAERIRRCGANDHLGKPFRYEDLVWKIKENVTGKIHFNPTKS